MRWWLAAGALLVVILTSVSIYNLSNRMWGQAAQLAQLRAQFAAQEHADRAAVASLNRAYARAEQSLTAAAARIGGTHRDLITCADWQTLFLTVSGTDSFNGQISASAGPPTLPQHCINQ